MATALLHQGFLYGSREEFVESMEPFVREGLEHGDRVFATAKRSNLEALREALSDVRSAVELHDTNEWYPRPYERLQAFRRILAELPRGVGLRAMGEPVWDGSDAVVREWARYESVINLALAHAPMRFVCLYDAAALPDRILEFAQLTHSECLEKGAAVPCRAFRPPEDFSPGPPAVPPAAISELPVGGPAFRKILLDEALDAGLPRTRVPAFVIAANEVATNAAAHGRPPIRAHLWVQEGELVCQISDAGPGIADPLAGWGPPAHSIGGGWGLAIARQLCDALDIVATQDGTTVSLHLSLEGSEPAGEPRDGG